MLGISRRDGYSRFSIAAHWIAAVIVVALFVTHEGEPKSTAYVIHVSGGAIAGVFLLWRVWHRMRRGMAERPDQGFVLDVTSRVVIWGFLGAIVVAVLSGYLVPWSLGDSLDLFGVTAIPSPLGSSKGVHDILLEVHDISGVLLVALIIPHILGAGKHAFFDKDGVAIRMFRSVSGGR